MKSFLGESVDVCIVGSGAGGAPLAFELARAGATVVVLEKGPWYTEKDFNHDEIAMNRRDFWAPSLQDEPRMIKDSTAPARKTALGWTSNCVGGGTAHMSGFFYRLHPEDFRLRDRYPDLTTAELENWPIDYNELAPYYDQVESEIGVSGKAGEYPFEPPRSGPYPYPPLQANALASVVDKGAQALGLHPFQTPRCIISQPKDGRGACVYCDFCGSYGCEVGAKGSTAVALLPRAIATGHCEVRTQAMVFEVATDDKGLATGVRYFDAKGQIALQKASLVCVSATAIESARLLLNSTSKAFPNGLANRNGLVGKHLHFSSLAKGNGTFERASLPQEMQGGGVHFLQRSLQDYYFAKDRPGFNKGGTMCFLLPPRGPVFAVEHLATRDGALWGAPLMQAMRRYFHETREIEFECFGEFLPNKATFVTVDNAVKDKWGIAVSSVQVFHREEEVAMSRFLVDRGREILDAAGASKTASVTVGGTTHILQHGTCRFGDDPKKSVLNRWCQSHDVKNLFVVDGSFMPTSGGVATTMTIMANSFRVADYLVKQRKNGAL